MHTAWHARDRRETRRLAAMLGATLEQPDDETDEAAEHHRLAQFCQTLRR